MSVDLGPLYHIGYTHGYADGRANERAAIVKWLRDDNSAYREGISIADELERDITKAIESLEAEP